MTDENQNLDELIEQSNPGTIVTVAAGAIALSGVALFLMGLQALLLIQVSGWMRYMCFGHMALGVCTIAAAYGFGKAKKAGALFGVIFSVLNVFVSGAWVLLSVLSFVLSLLGPLAFAAAIAAVVLSLLGLGSSLRAARARAEIEAGDLGDAVLLDDMGEPVKRSRAGGILVVVVVVLLLAGAAVAAMFINAETPGRPTRVVVVQHGSIDPSFDASFRELIREALEEMGLDALAYVEPLEVETTVIDAARHIAGEGEAAHAVLLELSSRRERDGVVPGTGLFSVNLTVSVVSEDETREVPQESMEFAFERATAGEVFRFVQETWLDAMVPWALDNIYQSPSFAPVLRGEVNFDEVPFSSSLQDLEASVERRRKAAMAYSDYCYRERERLNALSDGDVRPVHCAGDPCGQYTLIGVDSANRGIVQDISRTPIFTIPLAGRGAWAEPPERILSVPMEEGGEEQQILRAGHFYGFGNVAGGGNFAAVQPFGDSGRLAVYILDLRSGERHDVALLHPRERTSWAQPSPDGNGAAILIDRGPWLFVRGSTRVELPRYRRAGWVQLAEGPRIFGQLRTGELVLASPDGSVGEHRPLLEGALERVFRVTDGHISALVRNQRACDLVQINAADLTETDRLPLPRCLDDARMLPDGRLVGTAIVSAEGDVPGDAEVALVDPEAATVTPLTSGSYREETVFPTHDGRRVLFSRRLERWPEDHDLRIYRRVVCWVDVPPRQ